MRVAYRSRVLVIVLQFNRVLGEHYRLMLNFERALIYPDGDRSIREALLPVELPILKAQEPNFIQITSVAGREQDTVEELLVTLSPFASLLVDTCSG